MLFRTRAGNTITRAKSGGATTTFTWSADGLLERTTTGARTLYYDYNAFGQLVRKRTAVGTVDRHFVWEGPHLLAELDATVANRRSEYAYYPGTDQPEALLTGATTVTLVRYLQQDLSGNVNRAPAREQHRQRRSRTRRQAAALLAARAPRFHYGTIMGALMSTITIKGLPHPLYLRLKQQAVVHRRILNGEIIVCLERAVGAWREDPATWIAKARQFRERVRVRPLTARQIERAREDGRT